MAIAAAQLEGDTAPPWSLPRRLGFRILFCYFGLFFFPPPLPGFDWLRGLWNRGCTRVTEWVAVYIVHLGQALDTTDNGSADTTAAWIQLDWSLALAVAVAAVWTIAERRRRDDRLAAFARVYLTVLWSASTNPLDAPDAEVAALRSSYPWIACAPRRRRDRRQRATPPWRRRSARLSRVRAAARNGYAPDRL